jgi:hypothetical protein
MGLSTGESTIDSQEPPIKLSDIRTRLGAVCLHDVIAFLHQWPVNKRTKENISRLVHRNKSAFPHTSRALQDPQTLTRFEPKAEPTAGHKQRTREHHAIRTPEHLVEVINEYLQHHHTKSANSKSKKASPYDTVKAQSRELADQLVQDYLPNLWPDSAVNLHESFAPFFEDGSELPGDEDARQQGPSPAPSTHTTGPPPQVTLRLLLLCYFEKSMKSDRSRFRVRSDREEQL